MPQDVVQECMRAEGILFHIQGNDILRRMAREIRYGT